MLDSYLLPDVNSQRKTLNSAFRFWKHESWVGIYSLNCEPSMGYFHQGRIHYGIQSNQIRQTTKKKNLDLPTAYEQALTLDMAQKQSVFYLQPEILGAAIFKILLIHLSQILKFLPLFFRIKILPLFKKLPHSLRTIMNNLLLLSQLGPNATFMVSANILVRPSRLETLDSINVVNEDIFRKFAGRLLHWKLFSSYSITNYSISCFPWLLLKDDCEG